MSVELREEKLADNIFSLRFENGSGSLLSVGSTSINMGDSAFKFSFMVEVPITGWD